MGWNFKILKNFLDTAKDESNINISLKLLKRFNDVFIIIQKSLNYLVRWHKARIPRKKKYPANIKLTYSFANTCEKQLYSLSLNTSKINKIKF